MPYNAEMFRDKMGEQLKNARIAAGITVTEVAEAIGKNKNTIYGYELGRIQPTADVFLQLMMLYNLSDFDLFLPTEKQREQNNHPAFTSDASYDEFISLLRNADAKSLAAVKAMLQVMQSENSQNNVVNFNR